MPGESKRHKDNATDEFEIASTSLSLPTAPHFKDMSGKHYLERLREINTDKYFEPIYDRIEELLNLAYEEVDQCELPLESHPDLVLTPEGHLRVEWRKSKDIRIAIRFLDHKRLTFVTFLPDKLQQTQINRMGGDSSILGFFKTTGIPFKFDW